ncbi:MAG TPA: hypothetical protein VF144_13255 [Chitinophagaceae bacterium]
MNWHDAIGILSTLALFAPVFVIVATKLTRYKQYLPLFIWCMLAFGYNLMTEHLVDIPKTFERYYGIINNLTDGPLILTFLIFQVASSFQVKTMKILLAAFIVFEIILIILFGLTIKTITIAMGPGLTIVFAYSLLYFVYTVKRSFVHNKFISKAIIASALSFAYGCFIIIYLMHYVIALPDVKNLFLIYYMITIIYCSILSVGLYIESKRKKKLHELLITRRELMSFFADEKKPATPTGITGEWKLN